MDKRYSIDTNTGWGAEWFQRWAVRRRRRLEQERDTLLSTLQSRNQELDRKSVV